MRRKYKLQTQQKRDKNRLALDFKQFDFTYESGKKNKNFKK